MRQESKKYDEFARSFKISRASSKHDQRNAVGELGVCYLSFTHLAQVSRKTRQAQALEAVDVITALALVQTGLTGTLVDIFLTMLARESRRAHALVPVHQVLKETRFVTVACHLHRLATPSIAYSHQVYFYWFNVM